MNEMHSKKVHLYVPGYHVGCYKCFISIGNYDFSISSDLNDR